MEGLSDEISLMIALHLPLSDIYHLSLVAHRFEWLMEDQRLFRLLYDRDFKKYALGFPTEERSEHLHPEWSSNSKLMYKIVEFLRFEMRTMCVMREVRVEIMVQGFSSQGISDIFSLPIVHNGGRAAFSQIRDNSSTIEHMQSNNVLPHFTSLLILREGLCLWAYKHQKYFQIFPLSGVLKMFEVHYPEWHEGIYATFDGMLRYEQTKLKHPDMVYLRQSRLAQMAQEAEADRFGFRYSDRPPLEELPSDGDYDESSSDDCDEDSVEHTTTEE